MASIYIALMVAAKTGQTAIVKLLLSHNVLTVVQDENGNTAAHHAFAPTVSAHRLFRSGAMFTFHETTS
jgi:hypothetical protein